MAYTLSLIIFYKYSDWGINMVVTKSELKAKMRKDLREMQSEAKEFHSELENTTPNNKEFLDKCKSRAKESVDFFEEQLKFLKD